MNNADYGSIINGISKSDAVNLLQNGKLTEGKGVLLKYKKLKIFLPYINKM